MSKDKILILVYENEIFHTLKCAEILQTKYDIDFFCCDFLSAFEHKNPQAGLIKKSNIKFNKIYTLNDEISKIYDLIEYSKIKINYSFLHSVEKFLGLKSLNEIILKDFGFNQIYNPRDYNYFPKDQKVLFKTVEILLKKIFRIINKKKIKFIFAGGKSHFVRNIILEYAKKIEIPFYGPSYRLKCTFLNDFSKNNLISKLKKLKDSQNGSSEELLKKIKSSKTIENKKNIFTLKNLFYFQYKLLFSLFNLWKQFRLIKKFSIKKNFFFLSSLPFLYYWKFRNNFRKYAVQNFLLIKSNIKIKIIKYEKFIYYPLHFLPEGGVFDHPELYDESYLIQVISKKLPVNYKIIVKPHPDIMKPQSEIPSLVFFKNLEKIPNVYVVSPHYDSFYLIKKSRAVISVSGSPSIEAIIFNKPSFTIATTEFHGLSFPKKFNPNNFMQIIKKKNNFNNSKDLKLLKKIHTHGVYCSHDDFIFINQANSNTIEYKDLLKKYLYELLV